MEIVEFYFKLDGDDKEQTRKYEVHDYNEAVSEFKGEFPDEANRPHVDRIHVEHPWSTVV